MRTCHLCHRENKRDKQAFRQRREHAGKDHCRHRRCFGQLLHRRVDRLRGDQLLQGRGDERSGGEGGDRPNRRWRRRYGGRDLPATEPESDRATFRARRASQRYLHTVRARPREGDRPAQPITGVGPVPDNHLVAVALLQPRGPAVNVGVGRLQLQRAVGRLRDRHGQDLRHAVDRNEHYGGVRVGYGVGQMDDQAPVGFLDLQLLAGAGRQGGAPGRMEVRPRPPVARGTGFAAALQKRGYRGP